MRIVIDLQAAQSHNRFREIGGYTMSLCEAMVRNCGEHEIVIALNGLFPDTVELIRAALEGLLPQENIRLWDAPAPVDFHSAPKWRRDVAEYIREYSIAYLKPTVVLVCSLFEGFADNAVTSIGRISRDIPTAIILHDLPPIERASNRGNPTMERWYQNKLDHLRRADVLLSVSELPRQEAIRCLGVDQRSIVNISADRDSLRHFSWRTTAARAISTLEQCAREKDKPRITVSEGRPKPAYLSPLPPERSCAAQYLEPIEQVNMWAAGGTRALAAAIAGLECPPDDRELIDLSEAIARSIPRCSKMRQLLVDVSGVAQHDNKTGIQRVVRGVLREWLAGTPSKIRVEPVYSTVNGRYRYARRFTLDFLSCPADILEDEPVEFRAGDVFIGLDYHAYGVAAQRGFYHQLRRYGVQVYFVVYDLLPVLMPRNFLDVVAQGHALWLEVVAESDGAFCISKAVADELTAWMDANGPKRKRPFKIEWFHLGADIAASMPTKGFPANAGEILDALRIRPSFLMVSTIEPRKGHSQTLLAFERFWRDGQELNLVIVGRQGWSVEELIQKLRSHPEFNKRLFWLEGISDEYLEKIYSVSACLIAASDAEGFGLPLIEAAQHRVPVIARDIPVFREVAGEHAFYFIGKEPAALAQAITEWLALYDKGEHPKSDAMPWITWAQSAERFLASLLRQNLATNAPCENYDRDPRKRIRPPAAHH